MRCAILQTVFCAGCSPRLRAHGAKSFTKEAVVWLAKEKLLMHLLALVTVFLWAVGYVMTRVAVGHFSTEAVSFLRYFVAALTLIGFACLKRMRLPALRDVPLFFFGGAVGFAVYVYAVNAGSRTLTASVVSFLVSASPVLTALLARAVLKERVGLWGWLSVLLALCGVGVITLSGGGLALNSGVAWILLATLLISVYNVFQRKLLRRYAPLEITTYCIVAGALLLSVFAPRSFPELLSARPEHILAILVLGVLSAAVAYVCWAFALSKAERTSDVTNYMFLTPIITTFLGFLLIGEAPGASAYAGGALVLLGVLLMNARSKLEGRVQKR